MEFVLPQQTAYAMNTRSAMVESRTDGPGPRVLRRSRGSRPARLAVKLGLVVLISLALGGLTSPAQTWLPDALRPFANSGSGWTLLTALIVWAFRERAVPSAVFGAASFLTLVLGYQIVSDLRGFPDTEEFFLVAAIAIGPFVGAAASWLHRHDFRAALGCGVLAGTGLGEAAFGLTVIEATTGWFYWTLIAVLSVLLVTAVTTRQLAAARHRALAAGTTIAVTAVIFIAYNTLG